MQVTLVRIDSYKIFLQNWPQSGALEMKAWCFLTQ